jgi:aminoglycoside phosphotransferase (APT) family kinase protein
VAGSEPSSPMRPDLSRLGLDSTGATPLREHDASVWLLPREAVVVRLTETTAENRARAARAVELTAWLTGQGFPSVEPASPDVHEVDGRLATVWRYVPPEQATLVERAAALGRLLRELHALPAPPFRLPVLDPFARLRDAIEHDDAVLSVQDRGFLEQRIAELTAAFAALRFTQGSGLIHNDAHVGNVLRGKDEYVLADWESARWGPREVDLVPEGAPGNRFGATTELRQAFTAAYGYDVATWPGWRVVRDARDLHSLAAYIRAAPRNPAAETELRRRLHSLQRGDDSVVWRTAE